MDGQVHQIGASSGQTILTAVGAAALTPARPARRDRQPQPVLVVAEQPTGVLQLRDEHHADRSVRRRRCTVALRPAPRRAAHPANHHRSAAHQRSFGTRVSAGSQPADMPCRLVRVLCAGLLDHDLDAAGRAVALAHMRGTTLLDALAILQAGSSFSSHGWIEAVDVPTASVITLRDRVVPPHRQYTLARALPNNTVIEIDADHGAFLSAADQFATAVLAGCDLVCSASDHDGPIPLIIAS